MKTPEEVARETLGEGVGWHRMTHPALLDMMVAAIEADREQRDDYEAGYAEGFHHGRSTPRIGCNICGSALADGEPHLCSTDEREALIGLKLGSYSKRMPDGYPSLIMRTNEEAADVVLAAGFHRAERQAEPSDAQALLTLRDDIVRNGGRADAAVIAGLERLASRAASAVTEQGENS